MSEVFVFVGRTNRIKSNGVFPRLTERLVALGHDPVVFESPRLAESDRINARLARLSPRLAGATLPSHPLILRTLRRIAKTALALAGPQRAGFIHAALTSSAQASARDLRRFLATLPQDRIHLVGHSAGCIAATLAADAPRVASVTAIGYPFRNPDFPPQPWRTRHLPRVTCPLLVVQGRADAYGGDPAQFAAFLPAQARIVPLPHDHDYSNLSDADFTAVWNAFSAVCWPGEPSLQPIADGMVPATGFEPVAP